MIQVEQFIYSLASQLRVTPMSVEKYAGEIGLLVAFCRISPVYRDEILPTPEQVLSGNISLKEAYQLLVTHLPEIGEPYASSQLPDALSQKDVEHYLKEILKLSVVSSDEWLKELWKVTMDAGKNGDMSLPDELVKLMCALGFQKDNPSHTYTPFSQSIQLASEASRVADKVDYESPYLSPLATATVLMQGIQCHNGDPLFSPAPELLGDPNKFPRVLMSPPFGARPKKAINDSYNRLNTRASSSELLALQHGLFQCAERMVAIVPLGFLFRGSFEKDFRKSVVASGVLEAVIQLPGQLLSATNIPLALLVFDQRRSPGSSVFFMNADHDDFRSMGKRPRRYIIHNWQGIYDIVEAKTKSTYASLASNKEIGGQDYDLSVSRYVLSPASKAMKTLKFTQPLNNIAELVRAQVLLKGDEHEEGSEFFEVRISDIASNGQVTQPEKRIKLTGSVAEKADQQKLQPGDILLTVKGNTGRVALVPDGIPDNWVAGQVFQVIRLSKQSGITAPAYLFRYLSSPLVQAYLAGHVSGSAQPVLKTSDIKSLPVPMLSAEEQERVTDSHSSIDAAYKQIAEIEKKIHALTHQHWAIPGVVDKQL